MERIKTETPAMQVTVNQTIKQSKTHTQVINGILTGLIAVIFIALVSTYFVEQLPDVALDIRNVSSQAVWVFLGSYAIGELFKYIFINRARASKDYKDVKETASKTLQKLNSEVSRERIEEYCEQYADKVFMSIRKNILSRERISYEEYMDKYVSLSKKEILSIYPDCVLSKRQLTAIEKANSVKKPVYSADFLLDCTGRDTLVVPSKMYSTTARNVRNTILSVIFGLLGTVFAVSFASELIFNFSAEVVMAAIIKIVILAVTVALKINFANSLVMDTEISRFNLQAVEAKNCMRFCGIKVVEETAMPAVKTE